MASSLPLALVGPPRLAYTLYHPSIAATSDIPVRPRGAQSQNQKSHGTADRITSFLP